MTAKKGSGILNKSSIFTILLLTLIWVILLEKITIATVTSGIAVSVVCVYFSYKYLPLNKISGVDFIRLAGYPFYVIGQIYVSGIAAIRIILTEARADVVTVKTSITNEFLRVILANSITLIPGSVSLDLQGDTITVLWLSGKGYGAQDASHASEQIKIRLEEKLLKAQK